jgi:hypothetical protein
MTTNGHAHLSEGEINRIMDEWHDILVATKEKIHGSATRDSRPSQERELAVIASVIIPASFSFGSGSAPNDLANDPSFGMMWNYPEFARLVASGAARAGTTTEIFIKRAFSPLVNHEQQARVAVLENLFGRNVMLRAQEKLRDMGLGEDINGVRMSRGRRKVDSSEDPEELKIIPAFTATKAG